MRILDDEEVLAFQEELTQIYEMVKPDRQLEEEHFSKLESNLTLLGATAVDDKLQE